MTWFRVGGAGIPASLKNNMNSVLNKKFGTTGQNYPPKQWPDEVNLLGPLPEGTATGSIAHITDGADGVPLKSWEVEIAPTLTGKSAIEGTQTGKNVYNAPSSVNIPSGGGNVGLFDCYFKKGVTFTYSAITSNRAAFVLVGLDENGTEVLRTPSPLSYTGAHNLSFTPTEDIYKFRIYYNAQTTITDIMVEVGSTATTYEPYTAPTISTVNLGRTIYGGTADVVNGTGKSTRIKKTVRWGDLGNVTQLTDVTRKEIVLSASEEAKYITSSASTDLLNDKNLPYDMTYSGNFEHIYIANSSRIWVYLPNGTDANTEISVSYTLTDALQTDFTFDPISPTPETPENHVANFYGDTGDSTVVYRRDIDLALQAVSSSRGLMMASRPVTQLVGEESDPDQVNELVENDEIEQEGEDDAR